MPVEPNFTAFVIIRVFPQMSCVFLSWPQIQRSVQFERSETCKSKVLFP